MSLFKVKEGNKVYTVYKDRRDRPETYATFYDKPEQNALLDAKKKAHQLNKGARP